MERPEPDDPRRASDFAEVFDRCAPMVLRFARRRLGSEDLAWDVVSDTFMVAWRRWDTRPDAEIVLPWLYAIARHAVSSQLRASGRRCRLTARLSAVSRFVACAVARARFLPPPGPAWPHPSRSRRAWPG